MTAASPTAALRAILAEPAITACMPGSARCLRLVADHIDRLDAKADQTDAAADLLFKKLTARVDRLDRGERDDGPAASPAPFAPGDVVATSSNPLDEKVVQFCDDGSPETFDANGWYVTVTSGGVYRAEARRFVRRAAPSPPAKPLLRRGLRSPDCVGCGKPLASVGVCCSDEVLPGDLWRDGYCRACCDGAQHDVAPNSPEIPDSSIDRAGLAEEMLSRYWNTVGVAGTNEAMQSAMRVAEPAILADALRDLTDVELQRFKTARGLLDGMPTDTVRSVVGEFLAWRRADG